MTRLLTCLLALLYCFPPAHADPESKPLAPHTSTLDPDGIVDASLSPDSKHLAFLKFNGQDHTLLVGQVDSFKFDFLVSSELDTRLLFRGGGIEFRHQPVSFRWIDNDLIAVNFDSGVAASYTLDGKRVAYLGGRFIARVGLDIPGATFVLSEIDPDSGDVARVDARTGDKIKFKFPMSGKAISVAVDSSGVPRAVTMVNSRFWSNISSISNWYRPSPAAPWEKLTESGVNDEFWTPMYLSDDENSLAIYARAGHDNFGIYRYDLKTRAIGELMAGHPTLDILAVDGIDKAAFRRVWTGGMLPHQIWLEPAWARLQNSIDAALPNRINILSGDPATRLVVESSSDVDPGTWYLLDVASMSLSKFGSVNKLIDPAAMRPMRVISYPARDGLTIPAYLTLPVGTGKNLPTVIMIHGGPTIRDQWEWDADVQFLASQGYAVLQPQFRGSSGFGRKFEEAGFGQWGKAMQDDVTVGLDYLIGQGVSDPKRVCIFGASYGGYAALWGLASTPERYRCGISFAGVVDLELLFEGESDAIKNKATRERLRSRIGDIRVSKQQFDLVSPLKHADQIKAPVLLMHGALDKRVPIEHGEKMRAALEAHGKNVEWLRFEEEGHGLFYPRNKHIYYNRLADFLAKHLDKEDDTEPAKAVSTSRNP